MKVMIGVPVRDEEDGLPSLLASLLRQTYSSDLDVSVSLLFDGCTDQGVEIAKSTFDNTTLNAFYRVALRADEPNAGRARRAAMALALEQADDSTEGVLLTTDADSVPDADWVSQAVAALSDVDIVAGYTSRDNVNVSPSRDDLENYLERLHALRRLIDKLDYDPAPSHPWVGGANLGMRQSAYALLEGFRPIPSGEDNDFVDRARHAGLRVVHSRAMRVTTSSRMKGRACGGLADALCHMHSEIGEPRVEHPEDAARQYGRHAFARQLFLSCHDARDWEAARAILGNPQANLRELARSVPNAEAFAAKAVPIRETQRELPLSEASTLLDTLTADQFHA